MGSIKPHTYSYSIQGVQVKPLTEDGKDVSILYNSLLAKSGTGAIYMHYGFGDKNSWQDINSQPMEYRHEGWEISLKVTGNQLNFCFKDSAENWDNNNGANWAYQISN